MLEGAIMAEEVLEGTDLSNDIHGQCLIIYRDPLYDVFDHPCELIVHNQLRKAQGHSHF